MRSYIITIVFYKPIKLILVEKNVHIVVQMDTIYLCRGMRPVKYIHKEYNKAGVYKFTFQINVNIFKIR